MRHPITTATGLAFALALSACGGTETQDDVDAAPTVTETVTETESEDPGQGAESTTPSPDAASVDACARPGLDDQAFIFVTTPSVGSPLTSGGSVEGCANVFEASFQWELRDADQEVLDDGTGTASCGSGCVGTFSFTPSFSVGQPQVGTLEVFASSAQDGSEVHVNLIPVLLQP